MTIVEMETVILYFSKDHDYVTMKLHFGSIIKDIGIKLLKRSLMFIGNLI